jgi:hypothetical protein
VPCRAGRRPGSRRQVLRSSKPGPYRPRPLRPDRAQPFRSQGPSIRFTNDSIIREDGSPGDRRAVVGSVPLVGPVAAEVGLFSVTGATVKERELKRTDPMADVQPRRSRVAAVGLRMSF